MAHAPRRQSTPFERDEVAEAFDGYAPAARATLLQLRELIIETAARTEGVGPLQETLKWGQPAYLTASSRSGTTIRLDSKSPTHCSLFVHCQTDLVPRFRSLYPDVLECVGNREVTLDVHAALPEAPLRHCIALALTYHLDRRSRGSRT